MSIILKHEDETKEIYLDKVPNAGCNANNGSGLYLSNGKIVDANGNDVTVEIDTILSESTVPGDMIVEYTE